MNEELYQLIRTAQALKARSALLANEIELDSKTPKYIVRLIRDGSRLGLKAQTKLELAQRALDPDYFQNERPCHVS